MQITELVPLLTKLDNPIVLWCLIILFIIPVIFGIIRNILIFHNEYIRHFRTKNFEHALTKFKENSVEFALLYECKIQELVYINTKLNLSSMEREQILNWLQTKPVTVGLIKKAWPNIQFSNGFLTPKVNRYEEVLMWYSLILCISIFIFGVYILFKLFGPIIKFGIYHYFAIPAIIFLLAILMFRQIEPIIYARRLIYRLQLNDLSSTDRKEFYL